MARIILIDDSKFIIAITKTFLEECGHEVVGSAQGGVVGVELYKKTRPDLVLLDLTMPEDLDILEQILAFDSEAKVVFLSAVREPNRLRRCLERGAKGVICKPMMFKNPHYRDDCLNTIDAALAITICAEKPCP